MRPEFAPLLDLARTSPREELPQLLGDLEQVRIVAMSRLMTPRIEAQPDQLLDVSEAAARLSVSPEFMYRNHRKMPFARRIGRKLLFSSSGLEAYMKRAR